MYKCGKAMKLETKYNEN